MVAVDVWNTVVRGEPLIDERIVGRNQVQNVSIVADLIFNEKLRLLLHRVPQRLDDGVSLLQLSTQRPEHLIRTVMSGDFCRQQQLHHGRVDADVGPDGAQLVERRDDPVADRPVRLQQAGHERLLRLRGPDPQQH